MRACSLLDRIACAHRDVLCIERAWGMCPDPKDKLAVIDALAVLRARTRQVEQQARRDSRYALRYRRSIVKA